MPAPENTITTDEICSAMDQEFVENFNNEYDRLVEILGLFPAETVAAGTALYQYRITGSLNSTVPDEGEPTPLSQYSVDKVPVGDMAVKRYAKLTTIESILKGGYEVAVSKTDKKFMQQLRAGIIADFFTFLATGTSSATGIGLQGTLAQMNAKLQDKCEDHGDEPGAVVYFVNPYDIADYLAAAEITTQTLFGMTFIKSFLGVENILVTNRVNQGTACCTPVENIHVRGVDFSTLSDAGLDYESSANGLIGIHHTPQYDNGAAETFALVGASFLPEILDYIVIGTIGDGSQAAAGDDSTDASGETTTTTTTTETPGSTEQPTG